jgi:S-adenosylmethionine decarboxylase proenzyme
MSTGKHMICDIKNIGNFTLLNSCEELKKLMDHICNRFHFTILQKVEHQFSPQGITILYLLSESHFSIHTFPENNYAAIDLYTCRNYPTNGIYYEIQNILTTRFQSQSDKFTIVDRRF